MKRDPEPDHDQGRQAHEKRYEAEQHERLDLGPRVKHHVRGQYPGDRAAGAQRGNLARGVDKALQEPARDATEQVEEQVAEVTEDVLNVVPEDEEEEHVAGEMQDAGVQEDRGHKGRQPLAMSQISRHQQKRLDGAELLPAGPR